MINISSKALEKIRYLLLTEGIPGYGLRIGVLEGGCSGLKYQLEFTDGCEEGDIIWNIMGLPVYVDPKSYVYLIGTELDYVESLIETGFQFLNPNVKNSCSCSFSV